MNPFIAIYNRHKAFWNQEHFVSLIEALGLFLAAFIVQELANRFVARVAGIPVGDVILSNIPTVNTDFLIIQGALIVSFITSILLILKPRYLLFAIKTIALFVLIRSFFISLTHLGIDPQQVVFNTERIGFGLYNFLFDAKGDFFFSGHTGLPFLLGFVFWREKKLRYFFFITSLVLGVSVLLGHVHYSIDVFAAPFMAYGIYAFSRRAFQKDYELIQ